MIHIHAKLRVYHGRRPGQLKGLYEMFWQFKSHQDFLDALTSFHAAQHQFKNKSGVREIHENDNGLPMPEGIDFDWHDVIIEEMKIVNSFKAEDLFPEDLELTHQGTQDIEKIRESVDPTWIDPDELVYHCGASQAFTKRQQNAAPDN